MFKSADRRQVAANKKKLTARLAPDAFPLDYSTALRIIRDAAAQLTPAPVVSCEGANTMDNARRERAAQSDL
jgi:hypothetical protein